MRIRRRAEFLALQQQGAASRIRTASLLVLARPRPSNEGEAAPSSARLGVVASRRIGGAVVRNRAKRLVREAFRRIRSALPPVDVVVITNPSTATRKLADLEREMARVRRDLCRIFGESGVARAPSVG